MYNKLFQVTLILVVRYSLEGKKLMSYSTLSFSFFPFCFSRPIGKEFLPGLWFGLSSWKPYCTSSKITQSWVVFRRACLIFPLFLDTFLLLLLLLFLFLHKKWIRVSFLICIFDRICIKCTSWRKPFWISLSFSIASSQVPFPLWLLLQFVVLKANTTHARAGLAIHWGLHGSVGRAE